MKEYFDLLGIKGKKNDRWEKEFERKNPRAVELKKLIIEAEKTRSEHSKSVMIAKSNINSMTVKGIEMLYESGEISSNRRQEMIDAYEACELVVSLAPKIDARQKELIESLKKELSPMVSEFVDKKSGALDKPSIKFAKLVAGFVAGSAAYVVGFILGGLLFDLSNLFAIIPKTIDLNGASVTASAIGANLAALWIFGVINKNKWHGVAFCVWLIAIAVFYLAACLFSQDYNLIWYSVCSVIIDGLVMAQYIKENEDN